MVANRQSDQAVKRDDVEETVSEIASLVRNVCYDVKYRNKRLKEPRYAQAIGDMLINIAKRHPTMTPQCWDRILERLG